MRSRPRCVPFLPDRLPEATQPAPNRSPTVFDPIVTRPLRCELFPSQDDAKRAWLAKLDAPAWGAAAVAVTQVAASVSAPPPASAAPPAGTVSEDEAKRAWLSKLEDSAPSWKGVVSPTPEETAAAAAPSAPPAAAAPAGETAEEAAKRAWLAARE